MMFYGPSTSGVILGAFTINEIRITNYTMKLEKQFEKKRKKKKKKVDTKGNDGSYT